MTHDLAGRVQGLPERFVPVEMHGELVEAEHLIRYWWAGGLADGKRVLDAGCGTAYGSSILAEAGALEVVGVDVAEHVLAAARARAHPVVRLEVADVAGLPFDDGSFDVVVAFEVIEHVSDPDRVLDEFARVLGDGGVLVLSSPNRGVYPPGNPHHVHEFKPDELRAALEQRFVHVELLRQKEWITSAILDDRTLEAAGSATLEHVDLRKVAATEPGSETYTLALASDVLPDIPPLIAAMTHATQTLEWLRELDEQRRTVAERDRELESLRQTVGDQAGHVAALEERVTGLSARTAELRGLLHDAHAQLLRRDEEYRERYHEENRAREEEIAWLRDVLGEKDKELEWLRGIVAERDAERDAMMNTRVWRVANVWPRVRTRMARLLGRRS
jgi:SAM-dependent methyltransferase